jgi:tRNA (guanine37-N1)-methyltransferase
MRIDVVTIFPHLLESFLGESILGRARRSGIVEVVPWNLRDFTSDVHRSVDDRPYGGGPGMVMKPEPVVEAVEAVEREAGPGHRILLTPQGRVFAQETADECARETHLILICGRYEGFDERIRTILQPDEISIGDYVLSGGEIPAMAIIEAVVRLLPGALGHPDSSRQDSFRNGLLDFPQYTRPPEYRGETVPDVLQSGHHEEIAAWRREQAARRTRRRRGKKGDTILS